MTIDTISGGYAENLDSMSRLAPATVNNAELDARQEKVSMESDISKARETFTEILGMMTKGTLELSSQIDQKLQN